MDRELQQQASNYLDRFYQRKNAIEINTGNRCERKCQLAEGSWLSDTLIGIIRSDETATGEYVDTTADIAVAEERGLYCPTLRIDIEAIKVKSCSEIRP